MKESKYLIIGDGVAGNTAAEEIRKRDSKGSITILTDDSEPLYNRITLKTYMKGKMPKKFTRIRKQDWYSENNIQLNLESRVDSIDTDQKQAITVSGERYSYEKLLIATGGKKKEMPQDNNFSNFHYMWDWKDADRIKESAEENDKALVIGGGLLGIDLAVIYAENGCEVDYLIRGGHWWRKGIDQEGANIIHEKLKKKGVNIVTDCAVEKVESENGKAKKIVGSNGEQYNCDVVSIAIGRHPNFNLVDGDKTNSGALKTDRFLKTSEKDVYAAGDLVNYYSPLFERRREGGTWDHSTAMGRAAGRNMAEKDKEEFYFVPSYGVGHFDVQLLSLGENYGETVSRHSEDAYLQLNFEEDRLIGAIFIGDISASDKIRESIRDKESFDNFESAFDSFWNSN